MSTHDMISANIVAARQAATGLPLVALHSSAARGSQWKALVAGLDGRHRVVTPDLPGYGTAAGVGQPGTPVSLAADAAAVLRAIGPSAQAFHLVGHSYGGAVALKLALAYPGRVRSLTLIEPVVFHLLLGDGGDADRRCYRAILGVRDRIRGALAAGWPAYGMAAFVDFWNGAGSWDQAGPELRRHLAGQAPAVLRNFAAVLRETWPVESLARLPMPLMTVTGSCSPEVTRRLTDKIVEAASAVTAARVFGAGHMAPVTHAASVNCLIEKFVNQAEAAEIAALARRSAAA